MSDDPDGDFPPYLKFLPNQNFCGWKLWFFISQPFTLPFWEESDSFYDINISFLLKITLRYPCLNSILSVDKPHHCSLFSYVIFSYFSWKISTGFIPECHSLVTRNHQTKQGECRERITCLYLLTMLLWVSDNVLLIFLPPNAHSNICTRIHDPFLQSFPAKMKYNILCCMGLIFLTCRISHCLF